MTEQSATPDRFDWRLPVFAAAGALVVSLPNLVGGSNVGDLFSIFMVLPASVVLLAVALLMALFIAARKRWRKSLAILSMMVVYSMITWILLINSDQVRTRARWLLSRKDYQSKVFAQASAPDGSLKHIEWEVWGFAGMDTTEYLAYDPHDSLSLAVKGPASSKYAGLPCAVNRVRRLESHWYTVTFYTDTNWDHCT